MLRTSVPVVYWAFYLNLRSARYNIAMQGLDMLGALNSQTSLDEYTLCLYSQDLGTEIGKDEMAL